MIVLQRMQYTFHRLQVQYMVSSAGIFYHKVRFSAFVSSSSRCTIALCGSMQGCGVWVTVYGWLGAIGALAGMLHTFVHICFANHV